MKLKSLLAALAIATALFSHQAQANDQVVSADEANFMDEFDPEMKGADQVLDFYQSLYESETGVSMEDNGNALLHYVGGTGCYRAACAVYAVIKRSEQRLYLYQNGVLTQTWKTSTGTTGHTTPNMEGNPYKTLFTAYTSTKYPGGDYNGLGNMPYAVFWKNKRGQGNIRSGYAVHGTGRGNWEKLGRPASHGCVRIHPDNAAKFNALVRSVGVQNAYMRVTE